MQRSRLGVAADDFGVGPKQGLRSAARLGYGSVELDATRGDIDPANLSQSGVRHLRKFVTGLGLDLATLSGSLGESGLTDEQTVDQRIAKTARILELAATMRVPVVTTHIGALPDDSNDRRRRTAVGALEHLAEHADKTGTILAIQTAVDSPESLRGMLDDIGSPLIRVCFDPGGLLIHGHDPVSAVEQLGRFIASSHLRDATQGSAMSAGREVRMGSGQVNFLAVLAALQTGDYTGTQIVRNTTSVDPTTDLAAAKQYLTDMIP